MMHAIKCITGVALDIAIVFIRGHVAGPFMRNRTGSTDAIAFPLQRVATITVRSRFLSNADHCEAGAFQAPAISH